MLHNIRYEVTFALTDRKIQNAVDFQKGFGTITGPNESGKSFLLEMIRWLLFGSAALRGSMTDYSKIEGELSFSIKGERYQVWRRANQATLKQEDKVLAVGTKPVNVKIITLFGFGLDVFDMACVVNQMELVKLGQMRPADRKRMVDSVIGLGVIDDLRDMATSEALAIKREIEAAKENLIEPTVPEVPEGFTSLEDAIEKYEKLSIIKDRIAFLKGRTASIISMPQEPSAEAVESLEYLNSMRQNVQKTKQEISLLKSKVVNKPEYDEQQLKDEEELLKQKQTYLEAQKWLSMNKPPQYSLKELDEIQELIEKAHRHTEWVALKSKIESLQSNGKFSCPECNHVSFIEHENIEWLKGKLDELPPDSSAEVKFPAVNVEQQRALTQAFLPLKDKMEEMRNVKAPAFQPQLTSRQIELAREQWEKYKASREDAKLLEMLEGEVAREPDYDQLISQRMRYDLDMENFHKKMAEWHNWKSQYDEDSAELFDLSNQLEDLEIYQTLYPKVLSYVNALERYETDMERYLLSMQDIASKEDYLEQWTLAKLGLAEFRVKVKQHLIPSLNVAASSLIQQMTGGQRQRIEVDDDFEVRVDNQPLHTLSGSGMVVANLALRLGLGRVLTNNVFSVFIGDEIDSSMDATREKNTAETMKNLCGKVSQVLLITHKYPEADYYIQLGI